MDQLQEPIVIQEVQNHLEVQQPKVAPEANQVRELTEIQVQNRQEVWQLKAPELMEIKANYLELTGIAEMNRLERMEIKEVPSLQEVQQLKVLGIMEIQVQNRQEVSQLQVPEIMEINEVQDHLGIQVRESSHNKEEVLREALQPEEAETEEVK